MWYCPECGKGCTFMDACAHWLEECFKRLQESRCPCGAEPYMEAYTAEGIVCAFCDDEWPMVI